MPHIAAPSYEVRCRADWATDLHIRIKYKLISNKRSRYYFAIEGDATISFIMRGLYHREGMPAMIYLSFGSPVYVYYVLGRFRGYA